MMGRPEPEVEEKFATRSYQSYILDIAIRQNSIVYLPTGAGKTFIAVLLIKELSKDITR